MTSRILAAIPFVCMAAAAGSLHYGPVAGLNVSNFRWDSKPYIYPEDRNGLAAGGYLTYDLDPRVQIRAEMWYSEKGGGASYAEISTDSASGLDLRRDYETAARLSYLELPVLISFILVRRENQLGTVGLGPYVGWLLDGELETRLFASTRAFSYSREYRLDGPRFRRADFGLTAGLTAYVYRFDVNVRYSKGLRPALAEEFDDINRFMYPVNRTWTFSLGYQIK
jgi:hypothetical protein